MSDNPLRAAIGDNDVILFMKGTPEQPMCGFSARTAAAVQAVGVPFAAVDVLPDPRIRQELSALSQWPTIPQLFVRGELVGGADIVQELHQSGELAQVVGGTSEAEQPAEAPAAPQPAGPMSIENRLA